MNETDLQLGGGYKYQWECAILLALNCFFESVRLNPAMDDLVSSFLGQVSEMQLEGESQEQEIDLEDINLLKDNKRILIQVKTKQAEGERWTLTDPLLLKALFRFYNSSFLEQNPDDTRFVFLTNRPFNPDLVRLKSAIREGTLSESLEAKKLRDNLNGYAIAKTDQPVDEMRIYQMLAHTSLVEYLSVDEVKGNIQNKLQAMGRHDWKVAHSILFEFFTTQSTRIGGGKVTSEKLNQVLHTPAGAPSPTSPGIEEIISRCQRATVKERSAVGAKYIPELYMPRVTIENNFQQFLENNATCFLIVAKAGRGKTNLVCRLTDELEAQRPVLFLSGHYLEPEDEQDILRYIAMRLEYSNENWQKCFNDLQRIAESDGSPLIIIDGINESPASPKKMLAALRELLLQASEHQLKVCLTCRYDFWQFFRREEEFWRQYVWSGDGSARDIARGIDLAPFSEEIYAEVISRYFTYFNIDGVLTDEAWKECRNPLLLRFFCEAYDGRTAGRRDVGTVSDIRLYPLFLHFWERKLNNIANVDDTQNTVAVSAFVLDIANLMWHNHRTTVARHEVARKLETSLGELKSANSVYSRILDEEIILEEETNDITHAANIFFVYDKFAEFAIAQCIYDGLAWYQKEPDQVIADVRELMQEEATYQFATLRGSLEFLTWQVENARSDENLHFAIIDTMLDQDWKWRRIGSLLAPQLNKVEDEDFWNYIAQLSNDDREFVRRVCIQQLPALAKRFPERVVTLLMQHLDDPTRLGRESVRESLLNLNAAAAIQFAKHVLEMPTLQEETKALLSEVLLYPYDSLSPVLQEKARWLVKENHEETLQRIVCSKFTQYSTDAIDLFSLEELERAFQVDWTRQHQPGNPYLDQLEGELTPRRQSLDADLDRLQTLVNTAHEMAEFIAEALNLRRSQAMNALSMEFNVLVEPDDYLPLLKQIYEHFGVQLNLPDGSDLALRDMVAIITPADIVNGIANPSTISAGNLVPDYIDLPWVHVNNTLDQYYPVVDGVLNAVSMLTGQSRSTIDLHVPFGKDGLDLDAGNLAQLFFDQTKEHNLELPETVRRSLTNPGRLVVWILEAKEARQLLEDEIDAKSEELAVLSKDALVQKLSEYDASSLTDQVQSALERELEALLRAFGETKSAFLIDVLTPSIRWHHEHDSPVLEQAFDRLSWIEQSGLWTLAGEMLQNPDQRVIDFGSRILEQIEYREEQGPQVEVMDKVRAIVVDLLGVDPQKVTPEARFNEDLEADSLDLVELIMSFEDEFGGEISDEDAERITTVGEAAQYISSTLLK